MGSSLVSSDGKYKLTLIRKTRKLPLPGEVLVKEGDRVKPDTPIARITLKPGIPWVVPAARLLGIEPEDLPDAMLKQVGDHVKTKEVIARAKAGLYGRKELESPTDGIIEDISSKSGRIVIREEFGKEEPPVSVDVAFELGCRPKDVPKYLLRGVGQEVKRGQIFAKKGETSAFFTKTVRAPISGIIADVDEKTGYVTIARPFKEVVVNAYIDGVVKEVLPRRGAVIETPGVRLTGIFGVGREAHGEIKVVVDSPDEVLTEDKIDDSCAGKVVVGGSLVTNEALQKALQVGVRGVVAATASYLNIVKSLGVKLGVGITGQEEIDLTLILIEGFGHLTMRTSVFEALKALEGKWASINGATQIRAGAIRPEIIVTFPEYEGELAGEELADEDLQVGQRVRVINEPYFGMLGEIIEIPREPQVVQTEAKVPVVRVRLEGGEEILVPRANVEIF